MARRNGLDDWCNKQARAEQVAPLFSVRAVDRWGVVIQRMQQADPAIFEAKRGYKDKAGASEMLWSYLPHSCGMIRAVDVRKQYVPEMHRVLHHLKPWECPELAIAATAVDTIYRG